MGKMIDLSAIRKEIAVGANPENYDNSPSEYEQGCIAACENLLYILDHNIPAIDAEPVVHAEWKFDSGCGQVKHYRCSRCGRLVCSTGIVPLLEKYPYCNCGAKMEAKDGEID